MSWSAQIAAPPLRAVTAPLQPRRARPAVMPVVARFVLSARRITRPPIVRGPRGGREDHRDPAPNTAIAASHPIQSVRSGAEPPPSSLGRAASGRSREAPVESADAAPDPPGIVARRTAPSSPTSPVGEATSAPSVRPAVVPSVHPAVMPRVPSDRPPHAEAAGAHDAGNRARSGAAGPDVDQDLLGTVLAVRPVPHVVISPFAVSSGPRAVSGAGPPVTRIDQGGDRAKSDAPRPRAQLPRDVADPTRSGTRVGAAPSDAATDTQRSPSPSSTARVTAIETRALQRADSAVVRPAPIAAGRPLSHRAPVARTAPADSVPGGTMQPTIAIEIGRVDIRSASASKQAPAPRAARPPRRHEIDPRLPRTNANRAR